MWLSFIPVVGKVVDAVAGYFQRRQEVALEKYKIDGQFDMAQIQALAEVAKARATDTVDRWGRRLFIYPTGIYYAAVLYDSTFRNLLPSNWTWRVLELPPDFKYWAGAVVAYLLVTTWRNRSS